MELKAAPCDKGEAGNGLDVQAVTVHNRSVTHLRGLRLLCAYASAATGARRYALAITMLWVTGGVACNTEGDVNAEPSTAEPNAVMARRTSVPTSAGGDARTLPATSDPRPSPRTPRVPLDAGPAPAPGGADPSPKGGPDAAMGDRADASPDSAMPPDLPDPNPTVERHPGAPPEVARAWRDWPLPNFDYDHSRKAETRIDRSNVDDLRVSWQFDVSGSYAFGYLTANPIVIGDRVYIQDMRSNVYAIDRASGDALWKHAFDKPTTGPNGVAIGWGSVFAAGGDDQIVALDLKTGEQRWAYAPGFRRSEGIDIQPLVYDGLVFASTVPASAERGFYEGGIIGRLVALDAETGAERWSFDTVDSKDIWGNPETNSGGGAWYPPLIIPELGLTYWGTGNPVPWPGNLLTPTTVSRPGPNLYTCAVVAVGIADGQLAWFHQEKPHDLFDWDYQTTPVRVRPSRQSGADVVIGAGKTGTVTALTAESGELLWRAEVGAHLNDKRTEYPALQSTEILPGVLGGVMSALAYGDGVVYVASNNLGMAWDGNVLLPGIVGGTGNLTAIDVETGEILWAAELQGSGYGAATIANDLVFTSDDRGNVYAFDRTSGEAIWTFEAPGGINAPLAIAGDDLFVPVGLGAGSLLRLSLSSEPADSAIADAGRGTEPQRPPGAATFSAVYRDVLQGNGCAAGLGCHADAAGGGLDLSTPEIAYRSLVNVAAQGRGGCHQLQHHGLDARRSV